jgi:hypothetical protein
LRWASLNLNYQKRLDCYNCEALRAGTRPCIFKRAPAQLKDPYYQKIR